MEKNRTNDSKTKVLMGHPLAKILKRLAALRHSTLVFILLAFAAPLAEAQTTSVTGTVKDVNGVVYAGASIKAQLVLAGSAVNGQPTVTVTGVQACQSSGFGSSPCQVPFQGTVGPITLDSTGSFSLSLQDNALVTPAGTQWLFSVTTTGVPPPLGTGPQACSATLTITGASQSVSASFAACPKLSVSGVGGGIPGGANTQVQFNDNNVFGGDPQLTWDKTTQSFTVGNPILGSATGFHAFVTGPNAANFLTASAVPGGGDPYSVGLGAAEPGANIKLLSAGVIKLQSKGGPVVNGTVGQVSGGERFVGITSGNADIGVSAVAGTPNRLNLPTTTGAAGSLVTTDGANPQQLSWITNCSSAASPAVCGSSAAGSFVIPAAGTSVVVNTTAVTANSQIFVQQDDSLGTKLGVTCNTGILANPPAVTARTAATSFTLSITAGLAVNPVCFSYFIVN